MKILDKLLLIFFPKRKKMNTKIVSSHNNLEDLKTELENFIKQNPSHQNIDEYEEMLIHVKSSIHSIKRLGKMRGVSI